MTLSLSLSAVIDSVYAASAMYSLVSPAVAVPPALCRDQRPMLVAMARKAFGTVVCRLAPFVTASDTADDELWQLDLSLPAGFTALHTLRVLVEGALESLLLDEAYRASDTSVANTNARVATDLLASARRLADPPTTPALTPFP